MPCYREYKIKTSHCVHKDSNCTFYCIPTQIRINLPLCTNKTNATRRYDLGERNLPNPVQHSPGKQGTSIGTQDIEEGSMDDFMNKDGTRRPRPI